MRKAMVVRVILAGKLDSLAARLRFDLAEEELSGWLSRYGEHGVKGLRTTRLQNYRTRTADQNAPGGTGGRENSPRSDQGWPTLRFRESAS